MPRVRRRALASCGVAIFEPENGSWMELLNQGRGSAHLRAAGPKGVWLANCEAVFVIGMLWLLLAAS